MTILQGSAAKGKRRRGGQTKSWEDNIKVGQEWTLPAQLGQLKQDKVERDCCKFICGVG